MTLYDAHMTPQRGAHGHLSMERTRDVRERGSVMPRMSSCVRQPAPESGLETGKWLAGSFASVNAVAAVVMVPPAGAVQ